MVSVSKLFSGFTKVAKKELPNIVKTSELGKFVEGEPVYKFGNWNVKNLVKHPQAKAFIESAGKQNAKIINDVIMPIRGEGTMPIRCITKRLPSGTTVTEVYEGCRESVAYKEIIGKGKAAAVDYSCVSGKPRSVIRKADGSYITTELGFANHIPSGAIPDNLSSYYANGATERAMVANADYQALLNMGLVHRSTLKR